MSVFNLDQFPNVCRLCLKPEPSELYPVDGSFEKISLHIGSFLDEVTFRVPENKIQYLPKFVCGVCLKQLSDFAVYRNKLVLTLRFMEALIDLKDSNAEPLSTLFRDKKQDLDSLFSDISLCSKAEPQVEDLLEEFESYGIANYRTAVKEEKKELSDVEEDDVGDDPDFECAEGTGSDVDTKPEVYLCMVSPSREDLNESSSDDDKPLRKKTKTKAKSTANIGRSSGSKRRGRPRIHPDGSFLKEPWSCDKCKFKTKYRRAVDRHKAVHERRENRTYPCSGCELVFKTNDELRNHSSLHPENQVVCEICGAALRSAHSLKAHMERHEETRKYNCEYCDYTSHTKLSLKAHMSVHTNDNWNKRCEVCGVMFRTASRLKRHMEGHTNERKYPCEHCPARFNTTNALRNHRIRVHLAIRHPCEHCDKTFDQKIALRDHVERVHHIQCHFICDICVITYDSQEKLDVHRQRHDNPKPMECRVCLSLYATQEEFDGHLCISYREDYYCCNKDLRNSAQYNRHMWTKHGLRTNDRVKPIPGVLLGQLRGARKRLEQCRKCDIAFPSRALKLQHMAECNRSSSAQVEYSNAEGNYEIDTTY
ncbi:zinc finger protein 62 homolog [Ochlerotatus camptorhynchus]|uniref:zinc finger protein 62 homolog n=1 Tax=Ochlerotatus camptorhynchus TaxID=644619 RepID=UPI0031D8CC41